MRFSARVLRGSAAFAVALLPLAVPALALDNFNSRGSLKGLMALKVIVEDMSPDAEQDGLTRSQIQVDVEDRLRSAGISVDPSADDGLSVNVSTLKLKGVEGYAFAIQVECHQLVRLYRDRAKIVYADTWSPPVVFGIVHRSQLAALRDNVKELVDEFIKAFLEQNPRT